MAFDPRLRSRLGRLASGVDPDVEARLARTVAGARRRRRVRQAGTFVLEMTAVVAIVVVVLAQRGAVQVAAPHGLSGAWTTTLASTDPDVVTNAMNGSWSIDLTGMPLVDVTAPATFQGPVTGYTVSPTDEGDVVATDLLSSDVCSGTSPGTYRYAIRGDALTLTAVGDSCRARVALLTSGPWTLEPRVGT